MNSRNKKMVSTLIVMYTLGPIFVGLLVIAITFALGKKISTDELTHIVSCLIYAVLGIMAVKLYGKTIYKDIADRDRKKAWFFQTLAFSALYLFINLILTNVLYFINGEMLTENEMIIDSINDSGILLQIFSGIVVCVIGPMVEEILFRYIYQNWLISKIPFFNGYLAVILVAVSFGALHSGFSPLELSYYSLLGMLLGIIYKKTDSIAMVIIIHMINNTVGTLL